MAGAPQEPITLCTLSEFRFFANAFEASFRLMSNVLPFKVKVRAVRALVDGNSIRAAARRSGADKDVVMRLGVMVGLGCMKLHARLVRGVAARYIEVDETW